MTCCCLQSNPTSLNLPPLFLPTWLATIQFLHKTTAHPAFHCQTDFTSKRGGKKKTNKHTSQSFPKGRKERGKEVCSGPLTHPQTVLVWVSSAVLQQMPQKNWGSSGATAEGEEQSGWAVRLGRLRGHRVHCRNRHHPKNYWMILCKIAKWKVLMKNRF